MSKEEHLEIPGVNAESKEPDHNSSILKLPPEGENFVVWPAKKGKKMKTMIM